VLVFLSLGMRAEPSLTRLRIGVESPRRPFVLLYTVIYLILATNDSHDSVGATCNKQPTTTHSQELQPENPLPSRPKLIESVVITYRDGLVSNPQLTKASLLFIKLIAIETHLEL
jgi:hypothetical protein